MELALSAAEIEFRDNVRAFIAAHLGPSAYRDTKHEQQSWAAALLRQGWAAYTWPVEYGGPGWTPTQRYIWERETGARGLPARLGGMGMLMLAPILQSYGTEAQKRAHLPGILENRVEWCQGYSEPGAGSDLAALATQAVRDGDEYIVTGEKVWTSYAHIAAWMFALVRTSKETRRQDGISFLLLDMKSPGVSVHPMQTIDGLHTINRVVLDGVRVPVSNRIGEEGKGWTYAKALLTHERTGLSMISLSFRLIEALRKAARENAEPEFQAKIAEAEIKLKALEISELRCLADIAAGGSPGPVSSVLKLRGTEIIQEITTLFLECAGPYAAPWAPEAATAGTNFDPIGPDWAQRETIRYLTGRTASIAGGSDEVQRNIIAKHVLGLP
jgi:alkylation response protein AidB-like acyl-CoA dehydrogenase